MSKVVVRSAASAEIAEFPALDGVHAHGPVETRPVITGSKRPLFLWQHKLSPGSELVFDAPELGHVLYVWHGAVEGDGAPIGPEDAVIVERHGRVTIRPVGSPAIMMHFHAPSASPKDALAKGKVHIVRKREIGQRIHAATAITLYADASSDTSDLWFHSIESKPRDDATVEPRHFHTQDEVIFVVGGVMLIGQRRAGPGTAVAIDANTVYAFGMGEEGVHFINFRAGLSSFSMLTKDGFTSPSNERQFMTSLPLRPLQ